MRWLVLILLAGCAERATTSHALRVVSLHDVTTDLVVALGSTDALVGVAEPIDVPPDVQRALAMIPRIGGLESILAVRPDVVLGLAVVGERDPELVERLRQRGIDVYLADPATLDDVYALTRGVAARLQATSAGERLATSLRARIDRATVTTSSHRRVFVFDCCDPPFTAAGKTVLSDVIARAGGENIFADLETDWTTVSWEAAVARRPDVVVIDAYAYAGQGDVADKQRALARIPTLAHLPTVVLPLGEALAGRRSADALERLAAVLR